jgi:hypothetical protein
MKLTQVFKVYEAHRVALHTDKMCIIPKLYFSADTYTKVLQLCTITGCQQEFKLLNKHLQERHADKAYIALVKKLYAAYVRGEPYASESQVSDLEENRNMESEMSKVLAEVKYKE